MNNAARTTGSIVGALCCASCVTVNVPPAQCPATDTKAAPPSAEAALPQPEPADPLTKLLVVTSDRREVTRLQARCSSTECPDLISTFNQHFEHWLAAAKRQWLVITVVDDRTGLPFKYQADYLPEPLPQIRARMDQQPSGGRLDRTLGDGTHVVVLYAKDEDAVLAQIDKLTFKP